MSKSVQRLYKQFKPEHYELWLDPDRDTMKLQGRVTITGQKTGPPSQRLTFHQKDLTITEVTIVRHDKKGDQEIVVSRINHHKSFNHVRLHADQVLYPGNYTITLSFTGPITRPMNGIYPCFFEHEGKEKTLIATQFESHDAREAFPCIDEPEAKATFQLSLVTPEQEVALSNTPILKTVDDEKDTKKQIVTFDMTPKMSTYLLAFIYGEIGCKEATTKDGVLVRAYATPDNVPHTTFALDVAVKTLEFFNTYFDIPYPLPKCDLIALPDFASGAMENWGCITFREQALLVDTQNTSLPSKQYVALVVAHELAHQWFGNLVTMRWWTDLWLNEGFASWIEYLAIDHLFPEWDMWTEYISTEQEAGLRLDALEHTHPVEVPIKHPDEIRTVFDTISYNKGSSVIHMLHQYLGADTFRKGLQYYLKSHAYGNTDTVDLWAALETVSKKPVRTFMHAWTSQSGFPVVKTSIEKDAITLEQERFYVNPAAAKETLTWPIPLLLNKPLAIDTLQQEKKSLATESQDAVLINSNHGGFYRVSYDPAHLQQLKQAVEKGMLSVLDRLGLLSDAFETAKAGYTSSVDALKLLQAYYHEDNTFVWDVMAGGLGSIRGTMHDEALRESMKPFGRTLAAEQLSRLGWDAKPKEPHADTLLRPTILALASVSDEKVVVDEALRRFHAMKKPEDEAPDIRGILYGTAARVGGTKEFDKMLTMHNESTNSEQRVLLSSALTGFKQPELIERALQQIDSPNVRLQDAAYWLAYSFSNRFARDTAWEWMTKHWKWLEKNLGNDLSFYRFPVYAARAYSDASFLPTFKAFFDSHMSPAFERPVNQGCEIIQWQSDWRARDLEALKSYFQSPKTQQ